MTLRQEGRHPEAAQLAAEAAISSRRLLGPEHPTSQAAAYNLRETLLEYSATAEERFAEGDFALALAIFEEILAVRTEVYGGRRS